MKKLLGISLFAVLAATPLMASAADTAPVAIPEAKSGLAANGTNVVTATKGKYYAGETITDADKAAAASAAYVKGAYNAAISAVNKVAEGKQDALTPGDGINITNDVISVKFIGNGGLEADTNGALSVNIDNETITKDTVGAIKVGNITVNNVASTSLSKGTSQNAENAKLTTKGYVDEKVSSATSGMVTADSTTTFTNKTINAEGNSITNLKTTNFKSGTIVTSVGTTGSDTALPTEKAVRTAITNATANSATKEGVSASIDKATAKGNISATVSGNISGSVTSNVSALKIGGGTITNTVTPTTVNVPTSWAGSSNMMVNWGDTTPGTLNAAVTGSGSQAVMTGATVASSLANATVTSGSISNTLTGTVSGTATQNNVEFDVKSAGYFDNASDTTPDYGPANS